MPDRNDMLGGDDDIEFLYESNQQTSLPCEMCRLDLFNMTPHQRTEHYDKHFSDVPEAGPSNSKQNGFRAKFSNKRKRADSDAEDVFWHAAQLSPPPRNFTPGLVSLLKKALIKTHEKGMTEKAYLCSEVAVHINSESWDRGWGCGYRNFLMAAAALMGQQQQPMYFPLLDSPSPPGVRRLQEWLEDAWSHGYDAEGAQQLKHKLKGTSKWIGTGELYVAFGYRGIPAQLVDFDLKNRGIEPLVRWLVDYFTQAAPKQTTVNAALKGASPVVITEKLPIVLQHAGHSRTIIGYERTKNGNISLLVFDPAKRILDPIRQAALQNLSFDSSSGSRTSGKHLSPKKVISKILHPRHRDTASNKRARTEPQDVIVVDDEEPSNPSAPVTAVDPIDVVKLFRVNSTNLGKKDKYQILYFPMTEPLTEQERLQRKVVTSKKI